MGPQQAFEDKSTAAIGPFQPGSILNDRYRIEGPLGEGGFGQVFKAQDLKVHDKPVVVKVLSDHASQDEWVRGKFLKESEALARIRHPNVVEVLDKGATPEGKLFIVMQFVEGVTLKSALENGPLELARTAAILSQAAEALTAAHEQNVCHRDLKPANIMLRKLPAGREQAVLIDFGIAGIKDSSLPGSDATKVAGSLPYMAPEQLMGNPETASDIYSLGVIAYEMVTGRIPFAAKLPVEMYFQQQQGVRQQPSELRSKFPAAADQAIAKALAFDAKNRYARALDFSEAFSAALSDTRETDTRPTPKSAPPDDTKRTAEMAFVLFMDVVGYSRKTADQQIAIITKLQEVVRSTKSYRDAAGQDLISLPSGDGMALVFSKDPIAPVECALEVWRAVRQHPEIQLRMGINQGLVFRVADINQNRNVAGGGINMAQRVMDCGDAGHILVSRSVADNLSQLSEWSAWLHDLGECEVKHGVRVHVYNIYQGEVGNPARPKKCPTHRWRWYVAIAALLAVAAITAWLLKPPPAPLAQRTLTYYFSVLKPGSTSWIRYSREMLVPAGYEMRFFFSSPEPGHLYLLNEGPVAKEGMASFNALFPTISTNDGSSSLSASQELQFPADRPIVLDKEQGDEKIHVIWSSRVIPQLEGLKKWTEAGHVGAVESPAEVAAIQEFLKTHPAPPPHVTVDVFSLPGLLSRLQRHSTPESRVSDENTRTVIVQTSDPLVYMISLAHQ